MKIKEIPKELVAFITVIGLIVLVSIPNILSTKKQFKRNTCIYNLHYIEDLKLSWSITAKAEKGFIPKTEDLFKSGSQYKMPVCPGGGKYTTGAIGKKVACTIPEHNI